MNCDVSVVLSIDQVMLGLGRPVTVHMRATVPCSDTDGFEATSITLGRSTESENNENQYQSQ